MKTVLPSSSLLLLLLSFVCLIIEESSCLQTATNQEAANKDNSQGLNAINQDDKELAESSNSFSPYTDRRYLGGYGSYYGGGYAGGYGSGHYGTYYNSYNSRYPDYYGYNGYPGYSNYGGYNSYNGYYPAHPYVNPRLSIYPYTRFGSGYAYNNYPSSYYTSNYANSVVGGGLGALGTPPFLPSLGSAYNYNPTVTGTVY